MSMFCIELEGMMLPDAIAAVVEAWYDAQNVEVVKSALDHQNSGIELEQMLSVSNKILKDKQLNSKLKSSIYIEQRGGKLVIRGRLPSKVDYDAPWITQRISIGIPSESSNVKRAEILTCFLIDQLKKGDFNWDKWSSKDYIEKLCANIDAILNPAPVAVSAF